MGAQCVKNTLAFWGTIYASTKGGIMKKAMVVMLAAIAATALVSCGGGSSSSSGDDTSTRTGDINTISVVSSSSSGDFTPSVTAGKNADNGLKLIVAGQDIDDDGTVETPKITNISVTTGAAMVVKGPAGDLDCNDGRAVGSGATADAFDIGFCLDTTGSMYSASNVLAGKIAAFATELASRGVDAQFVGVTLGDAFATKLTSGSEYSDAVSAGPLGVPPTFDTEERPSTSVTTTSLNIISSDDMSTFFNAVKDAPSTGTGGGDAPENYLGCLQYMYDNTMWREGAGRVMVSVGDQCSHTATSAPDAYPGAIVAPWTPPDPANFLAAVTGNAVVHVIDNDLTCYSDTYNMRGASDATGGTFTEIGNCASDDTCNVDLITDVPIVDAISGGLIYDCTAEASTPPFGGDGTYTVTVDVEATPSGGGDTLGAQVIMGIALGFY